MATRYELINCSGGDPRYVEPYHISRHRTLSGALRAFRSRNRWLYDEKFAQRHGLTNASTFDRIIEINEDGDVIDWDVPTNDEYY